MSVVFRLTEKLRKIGGVNDVDCEHACFKYVVLCMLYFNDMEKDRQRVTKYMRWEAELLFDGIDVAVIGIGRDVAMFERLINIKVKEHLWGKGL